MLASSEGSKAWDWEEEEQWAKAEQVGGASARDRAAYEMAAARPQQEEPSTGPPTALGLT